MALTIYGIAASRALRPLWVATELGLAFAQVRTPYQGGATRTPEFLALNPNGHIPVLVDARPEGEVVVWESMACALYLARQHGQADGLSLAPATPREDAEALRWSFWTVNELEKDALTVLMHRLVMPAAQRKPELAETAERRLAVPLAALEQQLQRQQALGQAHLAAQRFTVADLCVASVLAWAQPARELLRRHPLASAWLAACLARSAYRRLRGQAQPDREPERLRPPQDKTLLGPSGPTAIWAGHEPGPMENGRQLRLGAWCRPSQHGHSLPSRPGPTRGARHKQD